MTTNTHPPEAIATLHDHGLVEHIAGVVNRVMTQLNRGERRTCVASSRVVKLVLREFGIASRPVAVEVVALNAAAAVLHRAGVPEDLWPDTAYIGRLGHRDQHDGPGWEGHLVLHVPRLELIVDTTAGQFRSIPHGVATPNHLLVSSDTPPSADRWLRHRLPAGAELCYRATPGNNAWQHSRSWRSRQTRQLAAAITKEIRPDPP